MLNPLVALEDLPGCKPFLALACRAPSSEMNPPWVFAYDYIDQVIFRRLDRTPFGHVRAFPRDAS